MAKILFAIQTAKYGTLTQLALSLSLVRCGTTIRNHNSAFFYVMQSTHIRIINQLFELEKKIQRSADAVTLQRPVDRIKEALTELGYQSHNPLGEPCNETRTDLEVNIVGNEVQDLVVTDVIKPIIFYKEGDKTTILQKGIVIASR